MSQRNRIRNLFRHFFPLFTEASIHCGTHARRFRDIFDPLVILFQKSLALVLALVRCTHWTARPKTIWPAVAPICVASSCFRSKMEDLEMYSDNLLFNKRQLGPIGQYTV